VDPALALSVFFALATATVLLFWPRWGLVARLRRGSGWDERVQLEDALKHLHLRERQQQPTTLEDLAGKLEVSTGRVATILAHLVAAGLASTAVDGPALTDEGRALALQTIRTHRLWERWLADRTGVRAEEWHSEAERMEHALTAEETDLLSARLGHPRYDPHGDPIPTSGGELPPLVGVSLRGIPPGRAVRIVHLEDEPVELYLKLLDLGMAPGLTVEVVDRSDSGVLLRTPDGERLLEPVAVGHVSVEVLPLDSAVETHPRSLDQVEVAETVQVTGISPACQGPQRRRLLDLGLVRGATVTPELVSTSKDPVAYRIRGALIALRRNQAKWISVTETAQIPATEATDA
jgi:DtxR family transcriptional regulator, Mn-dependent transcriptional regulator